MEPVQTLIDKAIQNAGSRYRLAQQLGEDQSFIGKVATGKKPMSPGLAARMAAIAGTDARRAALETLVSQEKDHAKAVALAAALGVEAPQPPPPRNGVTVQLA